MSHFQSKRSKLNATSHSKLVKDVRKLYHSIQKRTPRRQAYVRSAYFSKDKVFVNQFWVHLKQKRAGDQVRRLQLYPCAIDLIRNSRQAPQTIFTNTDKDSALHRFTGVTADGAQFYVHIKENKRNNRKDFMSCFPAK